MWNFKGALSNFTQNLESIHRKIYLLRGVKILTNYYILNLWHLQGILSLSETGHWIHVICLQNHQLLLHWHSSNLVNRKIDKLINYQAITKHNKVHLEMRLWSGASFLPGNPGSSFRVKMVWNDVYTTNKMPFIHNYRYTQIASFMGPTWVLSAPVGPHVPCYQGSKKRRKKVSGHPITHLWGWHMECLLWVSCLAYVLPLPLQCWI